MKNLQATLEKFWREFDTTSCGSHTTEEVRRAATKFANAHHADWREVT